MKDHNCTLLDQEYDFQCPECEAHFWEKKAKHNEDYGGLDAFLERRADALKDSFTREGIRQLA